MPSRIIVRNAQAPGDILVLSAAIRDLHIAHPGLYETDICVSKGAEHIYWNNPDITTIHGPRPPSGIKTFVAHYPLIRHSNQQRKHFIWGFPEYFNQKLGTKVKLTEFRPKIVLSEEEALNRPYEEPYWVFLSGGKTDFPAKIWDQLWWQQVISETKHLNWVQCGGGSKNHVKHERKRDVFDYRVAKTSCREFIRLIYHSEGVVCAVTFAMHVAAAFNKPCVVIAGGREPWWWEAYNEENRLANMRVSDPKWQPPPNDDFVPHRFLHTIGKLECCRNHGCWRGKVKGKHSVCRHPVAQNGDVVPRCLTMIKPEAVIAAIESYRDVPQSTAPVQIVTSPKYNLVERNGDTRSRVSQLREVAKEQGWIVWVEDGNTLQPEWSYRLQRALKLPCLFGRLHRSAAGEYHPYPGGFIVHASLLQEADTFEGMFAHLPATVYRSAEPFIRLSTRPA